MKIFLAGATGVVGQRLVPALLAAGHEVVGTSRSAAKAEQLRVAGAQAVVVDALNAAAVRAAVSAAEPDVVIHQLTAIGATDFKNWDQSYAATNQLRTRGVDNLLGAALAAGAKRFVAQSYTGWPNERTGAAPKTEADPLDPHPPAAAAQSHAAIRYLESAVTGAVGVAGIVLRFGTLYGAGTAFGPGGEIHQVVGQRKMPIVGGGSGVFSFVHVDDAVSATVAAVERGAPGIYNVVDDEPAPVAAWLPRLAEVLGAKPPRKVPAWLARSMLGEFGIATMTTQRGSSNAKAKRELGWSLRHPSWRQGFRTAFQDEA